MILPLLYWFMYASSAREEPVNEGTVWNEGKEEEE